MKKSILALSIVACFGLTACGGSDSNDSAPTPPPATTYDISGSFGGYDIQPAVLKYAPKPFTDYSGSPVIGGRAILTAPTPTVYTFELDMVIGNNEVHTLHELIGNTPSTTVKWPIADFAAQWWLDGASKASPTLTLTAASNTISQRNSGSTIVPFQTRGYTVAMADTVYAPSVPVVVENLNWSVFTVVVDPTTWQSDTAPQICEDDRARCTTMEISANGQYYYAYAVGNVKYPTKNATIRLNDLRGNELKTTANAPTVKNHYKLEVVANPNGEFELKQDWIENDVCLGFCPT